MALVCIWALEQYFAPSLSRYNSHEVDNILTFIERSNVFNDKKVLIMGDSVSLRAARHYGKYFGNDYTYNLSTNQAIEISGQYFILKRLISLGKLPNLKKVAIYVHQLGTNLSSAYVENFVLRTFFRGKEIVDVFDSKKDISIALKMVLYNWSPIFRYRLHVQKKLMGFTNSNVYSGLPLNGSYGATSYSLNNIIHSYLAKNTSKNHLESLIKLLYKHKVDIRLYIRPLVHHVDTYYMPDEIAQKTKSALESFGGKVVNFPEVIDGSKTLEISLNSPYLEHLQIKYSNFSFYKQSIILPKDHTTDGVHPNTIGFKKYKELYLNSYFDFINSKKNKNHAKK